MGVISENLPGMLSPLPGGDKVVNAIDYVVNWAKANSLWPLVYGTSCCAIEMMATGSSKYDWSRFGWEVARATPRQADLIVLAGTIVEKMGPRLITLYEQMPSPKYVVAMGACTISGGPFYYDSYSVVKGADRLIPVDVYIPGCPPRPEALLYGIMELQKCIMKETLRTPRSLRPINEAPIANKKVESEEAWAEEEKVKLEETKAAREKFKEENPDYKPYKHIKIDKGKFEDLKREPGKEVGKPKKEIFPIIAERFPEVKLCGAEENSLEKIQEMQPDEPLDIVVDKSQYLSLVGFLKNHAELKMDFLIELTAIDWEDHFDIVVHLLSIEGGHKIFLRTSLPHEEHPKIESISQLYRSADWHEREVYDFFGIHFEGHQDLRRLFLEDDFPGHPLRKDFHDPTRVAVRSY